MISHIVPDPFAISLRTVHLHTASPVPVQVRKLSGTSAMGYSRDGLENRLNNAYFELDKKIGVTLQGCSLAENARKDFQEVRTRTHDGYGVGRASCRDPFTCLSFSPFPFQSLPMYTYFVCVSAPFVFLCDSSRCAWHDSSGLCSLLRNISTPL